MSQVATAAPAAIRFTVYGKPATAGSKAGFPIQRKNGTLGVAMAPDNKRAKPWMAMIQQHAQEAFGARPLLTGAVLLDLEFMFVRPKSHYRSGKNSHVLRDGAPRHHIQKPDKTKLERCVEDALKRVVWVDDCQVVGGYVSKRWAEREGVVVTIIPLVDGDEVQTHG